MDKVPYMCFSQLPKGGPTNKKQFEQREEQNGRQQFGAMRPFKAKGNSPQIGSPKGEPPAALRGPAHGHRVAALLDAAHETGLGNAT